ncbi:sugar phosphate isomerase/epimerase family protein [Paenibacillus montanisoli]|uniref:sugar phosphate isomerase/epimerase family protein n=1 Tax=Paenibacillus montanisoli TaxID=2081970 RepID=UPI001403CE2D|nr:sugar phosphate isomerase/epimerase [Paenibacillus montanisoli]
MINHKLAVALFTLRDVLPNRLPEGLKRLKEMGCVGVETGDYFGYTVEEIAEMLKETGMKMVSLHRSLEDFSDPECWERIVKDARLLQTEILVFPGTGPDFTVERYKKHKELLDATIVKAAENGFRIIMHNHNWEVNTQIDGSNGLDYLLGHGKEDSKALAEFDIYWLAKGGQDPLAFISKYPNRAPILHMKDMTGDERGTYAEVGNGIIDVPAIIAWGEKNGVEWYMVEQDECPGNPWDSVQMSLEYLQGLKLK